MQTANLASLIETIFYIVVFYNIFKILARLFLPVLVKKAVEKAGQNFQQQYQQQQYSHSQQRQKDEVTIDTSHAAKPRETKKVGEYVDYEEIE